MTEIRPIGPINYGPDEQAADSLLAMKAAEIKLRIGVWTW